MTFHTEEQARALLAPLQVEFFEVEDRERQVATQGVVYTFVDNQYVLRP